MLYVILGVVLLVILAVVALAFSLLWRVKERNSKRIAPEEAVVDTRLTESSKVETCAKCGEKRIIVRHDDRLCAFCYSSLRTKKT